MVARLALLKESSGQVGAVIVITKDLLQPLLGATYGSGSVYIPNFLRVLPGPPGPKGLNYLVCLATHIDLGLASQQMKKTSLTCTVADS